MRGDRLTSADAEGTNHRHRHLVQQGERFWLHPSRGDEGIKDVFVNETAINVPGRQVLRAGDPVELEIIDRDGRREAANVVPARSR